MQTHVLDYLIDAVAKVPEKIAYSDGTEELSFREVYGQSRAVGTFLHNSGVYREPIVIFMDKRLRTIAAFYGVIFGGDYCVYIIIWEQLTKRNWQQS